MAIVKMDLTEYEALKEVSKGYKKSLEREKELQEDIKKLNDLRIKELESSQMKVIKMVKTESRDYVIKSKYKDNPWKSLSTLYTELKRFHEDIHSLHNGHGGFISPSSILKWIEHKLFEYHKVDKTTTVTNHEYVGLDKVRSEIRAEEEAKVKNDLDMARDSIKKIEKLNKALKESEELVKSISKDFENYEDSVSNYLDSFVSKVQLISKNSNIFNRRRNINKYLEGREKFLKELKNL